MRFFFLSFFIIFFACSDNEKSICDTSPTFSTINNLEVLYTSFSINGSISTSECDDNIISKGIVYSTSELPTISDKKIIISENDYSIQVDDLSPNSKYFVRAFLTNQDGEFYSKQIAITTLDIGVEFSEIETTPMINTVEISGLFDFNEGRGFSIESKGVFFNGEKFLDNNLSNNLVDIKIDNLKPDTEYSFQVFISSEFGEFKSSEQFFKTDPSNTIVSNIVTSNISYTSFKLDATYTNIYSGPDITTSKGFIVSLNPDFSNPITFISTSDESVVSSVIEQLNQDSKYYVKAFVENNFSTSFSDAIEVKTLSAGYNFSKPIISNTSYSSAKLYTQNITPTNLDIIEKGFYITTSNDFTSKFQILKDDYTTDKSIIESDVKELNVNTTYYIKSFVTNQYGTFTSEVQSFKTIDSGYNFSNINETSVGYSSVDLSASFSHINSGKIEVLEIGFYFSSNKNQLTSNPKKAMSVSELILSVNNLNHNTKYYYQAFVKNKFGEFKSNIFSFSTIDATPVFNLDLLSSNIKLSEVKPTLDIQIKDDTDINSLIIEYTRVSDGYSKELNFLNEVDSDYKSGEKSFTISQLLPKTTYSLKMLLQNDYGVFESSEYTFTTLNDTPSVTYTVNKSGDNSVDVVANFTTLAGGSINRAFIEYKNQEQSNYNRIELTLDENNLNIDNLIQGPQYDFKLTIQNEWNTYSYNKYLNLDVTYEVGDEMFGGIIVDIDQSGYHGIIMAKSSFIVSRVWSTNYHKFDNYAGGYKMGKGKEDSKIILEYYNSVSDSAPAFEYCENIVISGYDDWYLPSSSELSRGSRVLNIIDLGRFWSSTEDPNLFEKAYRFIGTSTIQPNDKKSEELVLPFRQF